jgi:hypothetical protein
LGGRPRSTRFSKAALCGGLAFLHKTENQLFMKKLSSIQKFWAILAFGLFAVSALNAQRATDQAGNTASSTSAPAYAPPVLVSDKDWDMKVQVPCTWQLQESLINRAKELKQTQPHLLRRTIMFVVSYDGYKKTFNQCLEARYPGASADAPKWPLPQTEQDSSGSKSKN